MATPMYHTGILTTGGNNCASRLLEDRRRNRIQLGTLNDRLADYVENVRFLEAQNKIIANEIARLRGIKYTGSDRVNIVGEVNSLTQRVTIIKEKTTSLVSTVNALTTELGSAKGAVINGLKLRSQHRDSANVDLEKLTAIEGQISLYRKKISIVRGDVSALAEENRGLRSKIGAIEAERQRVVAESVALEGRISGLVREVEVVRSNQQRINYDVSYRIDDLSSYRYEFRSKLKAAMQEIRDIHARKLAALEKTLESDYRQKIEEMKCKKYTYTRRVQTLPTVYKDVTEIRNRLSVVESRNHSLRWEIEELTRSREHAEKHYAAILDGITLETERMKTKCEDLSAKINLLCDESLSLYNEIKQYESHLNSINLHSSHSFGYTSGASYGATVGTTHAYESTYRYTSHGN